MRNIKKFSSVNEYNTSKEEGLVLPNVSLVSSPSIMRVYFNSKPKQPVQQYYYMDGDTLVFCEVKKRNTAAFGGPMAAITKSKQNKIVQTAQLYIKENTPKFDSIRFDAICLLGKEVTHIPNAFVPQRSTL